MYVLVCAAALFAEDLQAAILAKANSPVYSVAWSRDGTTFSTSWNNSVILWDAAANAARSVYSGHAAPVIKVKYSHDDRWLLTVGKDNAILMREAVDKSVATRIAGEGSLPAKDAVFVRDGYSIMTPLDGFTTKYCFRLMLTGQFVSRTVHESASPIYALDINNDGTLLLIAAQDGTVQIVDINTGAVISEFPRYAQSQIPPVFMPDGKSFLAAADKTNLIITPIRGNDAIVIRDGAQPVNTAVVSSDGSMVATALRDGTIKVFDVQTGAEKHYFTLHFSPGDVVNALAFSPDGEFLLAGTQNGYILRWSLSGKVFIPVERAYQDADTTVTPEPQTTATGMQSITPPVEKHHLAFEGGFSTITSSDYAGSVNAAIAYRNYSLYPFYCGLGLGGGIGLPQDDFTYTYTVSGQRVHAPYINTLYPYALGGLAGYLSVPQLLFFAEVTVGPTVRVLASNDKSAFITGSLFTGITADFLAGLQWKMFRAAIGMEYDSNYDFMLKGQAGIVIRF